MFAASLVFSSPLSILPRHDAKSKHFLYATMKLCNEPNGAGEHKANMDFFLQFFPSHCSRYCKMFYKINLKWKMGGEVVE